MKNQVGSHQARATEAPNGAAPAVETPARGATFGRSLLRRAGQALLGAGLLLGALSAPALAETRTLDLYYTHTKERLTITYKKDGRYIPGALAELNRFLRDWRRNESTKMDPRLFDVVWETYQRSGSKKPIHIVSAYRSLATNNSLRSRSKGVAKHSQHTMGKAMDWYVPDVSVNRLREIAMKLQQGGVGWYPTSGSPFVHTDVGSVRAWPRMSRQQLVKLFPDGKTVHLPADGKPLAGYQQALAELKRNGGKAPLAMASADTGGGKSRGLLAFLFDDEEGADDEAYTTTGQSVTASPAKPAPSETRTVRTAPEPVEETAPAPAVPVLVAEVPRPVPAPERPAPAVAAVPETSQPSPVPEVQVADAPLPPSRPDLPAVAAEPAATLMAMVDVPVVPPARPSAPEPVALAAVPTPPAGPADAQLALAAAPAAPAEPANAQLALAEVAQDPLGAGAADPTLLSFANPIAPPAAAEAPRSVTRSLAAPVPPAATQGLVSGQPGAVAAVAPVDKADPDIGLSFGSVNVELPVFDGGQSTYWGVYARFVHPDQRNFGSLVTEPTRVVVAGFGDRPYPDLVSTRFQGAALPTLRVQRFVPVDSFAMR